MLVDNGDPLVNCLAYIDLNPVRAGLVERPEDYRWCSLAYHVQTGNTDDFLSLDFGLATFSNGDATTRLQYYRRYVYENGAQPAMKGVPLAPQLVDREAQKVVKKGTGKYYFSCVCGEPLRTREKARSWAQRAPSPDGGIATGSTP